MGNTYAFRLARARRTPRFDTARPPPIATFQLVPTRPHPTFLPYCPLCHSKCSEGGCCMHAPSSYTRASCASGALGQRQHTESAIHCRTIRLTRSVMRPDSPSSPRQTLQNTPTPAATARGQIMQSVHSARRLPTGLRGRLLPMETDAER